MSTIKMDYNHVYNKETCQQYGTITQLLLDVLLIVTKPASCTVQNPSVSFMSPRQQELPHHLCYLYACHLYVYVYMYI